MNKIDTAQHSPLAAEFARLGITDVFPLSAEHGLGVDDLLDHVTATFPREAVAAVSDRRQVDSRLRGDDQLKGQPSATEEGDAGLEPAAPGEPIRVAIIGRPNVGKSTLLNRLLNEERSIVTPLPGTTRDAVDAEFERDSLRFRLIDTAGIRRKGKTKLLAEKLSVIQARKHLERADVALLLIDAVEGPTAVDAHIGGYAHESHRSLVIVVNKWDAIAKGATTTQDFTAALRRKMKYLDYAPIVFISALSGQRLGKLIATVAEVARARQVRIPTAEMNRFLQEVDFDRATSPGRPFKLYYLTQASTAPPTFVAFTNQAGKLHFALERFLENRLRERFGFLGTPLVIRARRR